MKKTAASLLGKALVLALILAFVTSGSPKADEPKQADQTYRKQVLIIRHAEKPPDEAQSVHLSEQGEKRAKALPQLFEKSANRPDPFSTPDFIFATHNTEDSHRPVETVTPFAKKLGLPINDAFKNKEKGILDLSKEIFGHKRYQGKTVLICWHHGTIPDLAKALRATDVPDKWDHKAFDRVWQITYDQKGKTTFVDRPQLLLPDDAKSR